MHLLANKFAMKAWKFANQRQYHKFSNYRIDLIVNGKYIDVRYSRVSKIVFHAIKLKKFLENDYEWTDKTKKTNMVECTLSIRF